MGIECHVVVSERLREVVQPVSLESSFQYRAPVAPPPRGPAVARPRPGLRHPVAGKPDSGPDHDDGDHVLVQPDDDVVATSSSNRYCWTKMCAYSRRLVPGSAKGWYSFTDEQRAALAVESKKPRETDLAPRPDVGRKKGKAKGAVPEEGPVWF